MEKRIIVTSTKELKQKIKSCLKLGLNYKLSGKVIPCRIDFFFKDEGIIFSEEDTKENIYNLVPKNTNTKSDNLTKQLYNFSDTDLKFVTIIISEDVEGKIKTKQEFIVTNTFYGKKYFNITEDSETELYIYD